MRSRKTINLCPICSSTRAQCVCDAIPRIELATRVCLVIHHKELKRTSNTGLLALRALVNSEMRVRGEARAPLDLTDLLTSRYRTFLFYPSDDAVELDRKLAAEDGTPIQLIVPDGSWGQAGKVPHRHPELKDVRRVKLGAPVVPSMQLRVQHRPEGMATLQAIAHALGIIEGDPVRQKLMDLYDLKVARVLSARGVPRWKARLDRASTRES